MGILDIFFPKPDPGAKAAAVHGLKRSDKWPGFRRAHLKLEPACRRCGCTDDLEVHHIFPFHLCVMFGRPDLELDHRNLITLCNCKAHLCHLLLGHLDNYEIWNLAVTDILSQFQGMSAIQIKQSSIWLQLQANRPKPIAMMTDQDKTAFTERMNATYP